MVKSHARTSGAPAASSPRAVIWLAPAGADFGIFTLTSKRPSLPAFVVSSVISSPVAVMNTRVTTAPGAKPPASTCTRCFGSTSSSGSVFFLPGSVTAPGVVGSRTSTLKALVATLPFRSVAVQVTGVVPKANLAPLGATQETATAPSRLSLAVGFV